MSTVEPSAEEAVIPKVPVEGEEESAPEPDTPSDPLDAIEDEVERNEAKRLRAIDRRAAKKVIVPPEEEEKKEPESQYATKEDLKRMATVDAKKLLAPEVLEVWDDLTSIELGGFDSLDADSIAKNMAKRYTLYRQDNPIEGEDPAKDLVTSPKLPVSGAGGKKPVKKAEPSLPGYKEAVHPDNWYPAKE